MEHNPDVVQCFMDFAMSALTSFASILYTLPDAVEAVLKTAIQALEVQERVGLQKSIQLLVRHLRSGLRNIELNITADRFDE